MSDLYQRPLNLSRLATIVATILFMWVGQGQVMGQITQRDTCICTDNPLRALDSIIIETPTADPVYVSNYSPRISPNQVLYYEAFGSDFYLSWQTPARDTLVLLNPGGPMPFRWLYKGYRVSSEAFTNLTFGQNGSDLVSTSFGACTPPDDSIMGIDSICMNDGQTYTINIPNSVLASSIWTLSGTTKSGELFGATGVPMDALTGSGTFLTPMTGSGVRVGLTYGMASDSINGNGIDLSFGSPGDYTLMIEGATNGNCTFGSSIDIYVQDNSYRIEGFDQLCALDQVMFNIPVDATYDSIMWSVQDTNFIQIVGDSTTDDVMIQVQDTTGMVELYVYARSGIGAMCEIYDTLSLTIADVLAAQIVSTDTSRLGIMADTVVCLGDVREFGINVFNTDTVTWTSLTGYSSFPSGSMMMDTVDIQFDSIGIDTIVVQGTTVMGCTFSDSLIIRIQGTDVMINGMVDVCAGETTGYSAMYADGSPAEFMSIEWSILADTTVADTMITSTGATPGDSLIATWFGTGNYDIVVTGMTMAGCMLEDTFTVNVIDTSFTILGPDLTCVGSPATFAYVQSSDSSDVLSLPMDSVFWQVSIGSPAKADGLFTLEALTDMDFNDTLVHTFQTSTFDKPFDYYVVANGFANGCMFSDTFVVEVVGGVGDSELAIIGPSDLNNQCSGADDVLFRLGIPDSILNGPVIWTVTQFSEGAPLPSASINASRIDSAFVTFPNVADTFMVRAQGELGGQCPFDISLMTILNDDIGIIDAMNIDTTCLTQDSQVYVINVDTSMLTLTDLSVSIERVDNGALITPLMTNSGSRIAAYTTWEEAGEYILRFRGNIDSTGCDIDESLNITVKDTAYIIDGDFQICAGDTTQYVLLQGWDNMAIPDFPMGDSVDWVFDPMAVDTSFVTGVIGDTITIVWSPMNDKYALGVSDSTLCCPIEVMDSVLVRVPGTFALAGPDTVCVGEVAGYLITNSDGSYIDDLIPDSTQWSITGGSVVGADRDSLTVEFNIAGSFVSTPDTIVFRGMTNDGCEVLDTIIVTVRSTDAVILGPTAVCIGDSVNLNLVNAADSSFIMGLSSVEWIITPGDTTMSDDTLMTFIDSMGMSQPTWTEPGTFTVIANAFIGDSCIVTAATSVNVSTLPEDGIEGDLNTCINSFDMYMLDIAAGDVDTIFWTVNAYAGTNPAGAMIVGSSTGTEVEINWTDVGLYYIEVTGRTVGGCEFFYTQDITIVDAANIGQLVCNNDINVTLSDACELMLTPDMILEQPDPTIPDEQYEITVRDKQTGIELSKGLVDVSLLGIELEVEIVHECSGQSCWGFITLEDKNIPELICASDTLECDASVDPRSLSFGPERRLGFPVPADITNITQINNNPPTYRVVGYEKCGDAILTYNDRIDEEVCTGDFGTIIYRDWTLTNFVGLESTCTDTLNIKRVALDSIDLTVLPLKLTFDCSINENSLQPGSLTGDLNLATDPFCFNIQAQFTDNKEEGCSENVYTIIRDWTLFDWCTGDVITHTQTIQVVDTIGPDISISTGPINLEATDHSCTGLYDLTPDLTITDDCSGLEEVTVRIWDYNEHLPPGTLLYTITDMDYDSLFFADGVTQVQIEVVAVDSCGRQNEETVIRDVRVTDNVQPIPICDENTTVSIGSNGWAIADFHAFDDGSIDNCGIERICITRMDHYDMFETIDTDNNGIIDFATFQLAIDGNEDEFGPLSTIYEEATEIIGGVVSLRKDSLCRSYTKFNCFDAMDTTDLMIRLEVFDLSGNSNFCMVNTEVQDNSPIKKTVRQDDITISCQDDVEPYLVDDGSTVSFITSTCGIPMPADQFTARVDTNDCGIGMITRDWRITDDFNNTVTHRQIVTIGLESEQFDTSLLSSIWPMDYIGEGCAGPGTEPENLDPEFRVELDLTDYPCSSLFVDHEDLVFYNVEGFCAKILRTWTIIDWCNRVNGRPAEYTHVQLLKVNDSEAPVITSGCDSETFTVTNSSNCSAFVSTSAQADDCIASEELRWKYEIRDLENDLKAAGSTNAISTNLEQGEYNILWIAEDRCGNRDSCTKMITVVDGVAPVIECRNREVTIGTDGTVTVTPQEFIELASDNCAPDVDLTYTFQSASGATSQEFTCTNLGANTTRDFTIEVFVTDAFGNSTSCSVTLTLVASSACQINVGNAAIAGMLYTEQDFTIDDAEVTVTGMSSGESVSMMTPLEGLYAFAELPMQSSYEVTAERDDDYLNGVSTLDIVMIQQHILGIRNLDSPYKMIAADVDASGRVSASDLVNLRRLILGRTIELPIGQSWTFVDAGQTWENDLNPFPYNQSIMVDDLESDMEDVDFVGIKMGDVNGNVSLESAILGITRSTEPIKVKEVDRAEDELSIGFAPVDNQDIMGIQMAIAYDRTQAEILGVISDVIEITSDNYSIVDGELRISWYSDTPIDLVDEEPLFEVITLASTTTSAEDIVAISTEHIASEIYRTDGNDIGVSELFLEHEAVIANANDVMIVEQNTPNPWQQSTSISWYQPKEGEMTLRVFDLTGKELMQTSTSYGKGWHKTSINQGDIDGSGVYIYQMTDGTSVIRKKMIIVK